MNLEDKRHYGFDLLRIICMLMIITHHAIGHGGLLSQIILENNNVTVKYFFVVLANYLSIVAVNCFVLLSGFYYENNTKPAKHLIPLWFQTVFYSIGIFLMFYNLDIIKNGGVKVFFKESMPITFVSYWFMTAYFGMMIFTPIINKAVLELDKKVLVKFLLTSFIAFSVLPILTKTDPYHFVGGYSTWFFVCLYVLGACIKKFNVIEKYTTSTAFVSYLVCILLLGAIKMSYEVIKGNLGHLHVLGYYISPLVIIASCFLFITFSKITIHNEYYKSVITALSKSTLGVYLIHDNKYVRKYVVSGLTKQLAYDSCWIMLIKLFLIVLSFFVFCSIVEHIRIKLYKSLKMDLLYSRIYDLLIKLKVAW